MSYRAVTSMLYDEYDKFTVDLVTTFLQSHEGTTDEELHEEIPASTEDINDIVCAYKDERCVYVDSQVRYRWNWKG